MQSTSEAEADDNSKSLILSETVSSPKPPEVEQSTEIGMVKLSDTPENIAKQFDDYEELRSLILKEEDFYEIKNKEGKVVGYGVSKNGLYKLGVAFNLSTFIVEEKKLTRPDKPDYIAYQTTVQCTAPNGRLVMEVGFCDNTENDRNGMSEHIIRAMAKTRATERAYVVMTGETGKKPKAKNPNMKTKPSVFCQCQEPKTGIDGKCKTCGAVDKVYYEHHKDEFK